MNDQKTKACEASPYNLSKKSEVERWFREMKGYLNLEKYHFTRIGTDFKGREFALDAFDEIAKIAINSANSRDAALREAERLHSADLNSIRIHLSAYHCGNHKNLMNKIQELLNNKRLREGRKE